MSKAFHPAALLRRFMLETGGSVLALGALLLPVVGGAALFGLDHMRATRQVAAMQKAADAAALASVRQMAFVMVESREDSATQNATLTAIAEGLVRSTLDGRLPDATTAAELLEEGLVRVSLTARYGSLFGEMGFFGENPFTVTSSARTFGGQDVCFIALGSDSGKPGIHMTNSAQLQGGTCEIYSSSKREDSITVDDSARIEARLICSGGGADGPRGNYSTPPATDCAQIEDPLRERPPPDTGGDCDYHDINATGSGTLVLWPGIYCGKVMIENSVKVMLNPGIHVFRDSEIHIHDNASLKGSGVGLYFEGEKATLHFNKNAHVKLSAPTTGPMAGILIAARPHCKGSDALVTVSTGGGTPGCDSGREFSIESANVDALLGTIHLPTDTLKVNTTMPVSKSAAFTIIVAGRLKLEGSPTLVLNTDYDATDVPVPSGFRDGSKSPPRLVN